MHSLRPSDLLEQIARCELLADELDAGRIGPELLLEQVATLRMQFDAHAPVAPAGRTSRIDRRSARHPATITDELRDTLDRLREHLAAT